MKNYIPKCYIVKIILISFNCFSEYIIYTKSKWSSETVTTNLALAGSICNDKLPFTLGMFRLIQSTNIKQLLTEIRFPSKPYLTSIVNFPCRRLYVSQSDGTFGRVAKRFRSQSTGLEQNYMERTQYLKINPMTCWFLGSVQMSLRWIFEHI